MNVSGLGHYCFGAATFTPPPCAAAVKCARLRGHESVQRSAGTGAFWWNERSPLGSNLEDGKAHRIFDLCWQAEQHENHVDCDGDHHLDREYRLLVKWVLCQPCGVRTQMNFAALQGHIPIPQSRKLRAAF
jgi:hypothetical protein